MSSLPADWIVLRSSSLFAAIDPQGAQLSVLRDAGGRDLLCNGDATFWNGRAPILFPIVGTLNNGHYRWKGQLYPLSRHGFARGQRFAVVGTDARSALLGLPVQSTCYGRSAASEVAQQRFVMNQRPSIQPSASSRSRISPSRASLNP
ncbi:MAG: hypothetical protein ABI616_02505 [Pseudomonadota bacterium]